MFRSALFSNTTRSNSVDWINRGLEITWLLTIVLVPLLALGRTYGEWSTVIGSFELPKIVALRILVALMPVLWLTKWAIQNEGFPDWLTRGKLDCLRPIAWPRAIYNWLNTRPTRWIFLTVWLYLGSVLMSTVLSGSISTSLWGDVPGQDSYSAYTVVAYVMLFAVIATHLKSHVQMWRLLAAIVFVGVMVGGYSILQHFGHDFLDLIEPASGTRSSSTLGNSLFAAAVLLFSIPITLAAATLNLRVPWRSRTFWWRSGLWAVVMAIELLGIIYTLSRGPWIGTLFALGAFLVLVTLFAERRSGARAALVLLMASLLTIAIVIVPSKLDKGDASGSFTAVSTTVSQRVATGVSGFTDGSDSGTLDTRVGIWKNSWQLMSQRPWFEFEDQSFSMLRTIIGYGPDLFRPTYLLVSPPDGKSALPHEVAQAHNYFVHQGVELGFLGLATSIAVFFTLFLVGGWQIARNGHRYSLMQKLLLAVLLSTLAGRLLEQMVGVARVSDLTIGWVLMGVVVALPLIGHSSTEAPNDEAGSGNSRTLILQQRGPGRARLGIGWVSMWRPVVVVCLVGAIVFLTWEKSINYQRAALIADHAATQFRAGDRPGALASLDRAIDLAPDVSPYYARQAEVYQSMQESLNLSAKANAKRALELKSDEQRLSREKMLRSQIWADIRPYDVRSRLSFADSKLALALLNKDETTTADAGRLYQESVELVPNSYTLINVMAKALLALDQPEAALTSIETSLAITGDAPRSVSALQLKSRAFLDLGQPQRALQILEMAVQLNAGYDLTYLLRGAAHFDLGEFNRAREDFEYAIRITPGLTAAYTSLGTVYYHQGRLRSAINAFDEAIRQDPTQANAYNSRGLAYMQQVQLERALEDFQNAISLDLQFAEAYNNQGLVYRDLERLEEALQSLSKAVNIDPQLALAYYNRALTYALLGRDSEVQQDADRAKVLGIDSTVLEEALQKLRESR